MGPSMPIGRPCIETQLYFNLGLTYGETSLPRWQCNIKTMFHLDIVLVLHIEHGILDAMMNNAWRVRWDAIILTSTIMLWVMAYMKHWMLWCIVMDSPLDYVEGLYIDDEKSSRWRLLMDFLVNHVLFKCYDPWSNNMLRGCHGCYAHITLWEFSLIISAC